MNKFLDILVVDGQTGEVITNPREVVTFDLYGIPMLASDSRVQKLASRMLKLMSDNPHYVFQYSLQDIDDNLKLYSKTSTKRASKYYVHAPKTSF